MKAKILLSFSCIVAWTYISIGGAYLNSWSESSASQRLSDGSRRNISITWHVSGDLDQIGDQSGTDLSGKIPDTFKNIHITNFSYSSSDAPFDLTIPWFATWLSGGSADTTYPRISQVDASAFRDCDDILSVTLPTSRQAGIERIGMPCFLGCRNLAEIKSGQRDGDLAWSSAMCHYHTENGVLYDKDRKALLKYPEGKTNEVFVVPHGVDRLEEYSMAKTRFLNSLVFSGDAPEIGEKTFLDSSVKTIYYIRGTAGWEDDNLFDKVWPIQLKSLGSLDEMKFSLDIVKGVVKGFSGVCPANLTIPNGVTRIGNCAFEDCVGIKSVAMPKTVTSIGNYAFNGCSSLARVELPGVVEVGDYAFCDCSSLERVEFPGVVEVGKCAFRGCAGLADDDGFVIVCDVLFDFYDPFYIFKTYIPSGVRKIDDSAFRRARFTLVDVEIPPSVREIGRSAFEGCRYLENVVIHPGATNINDWSFKDCARLSSVSIPEGVVFLGAGAFESCVSLASVSIPDSVVSMDWDVFDGCANELYDTTSIPGVKLVDGWIVGCSDSLSSRADLSGARGIAGGAFYGCSMLQDVVLPPSIRAVCSGAFRNCASLKSVVFPESVCLIGDYVFMDSAKIKSVTLPSWCKNVRIYDREPTSLTGSESPFLLSSVKIDGMKEVDWRTYLDLKKSVKLNYNKTGATVTVSFNANGGRLDETSRTIAAGAAIGATPVPERLDYVFAGWFTAAFGGRLVTASTVVSSDTVLYAHWTATGWTTREEGDDAVVVKTCTNPIGDVTIPRILNGREVVGIDNYAFFGASNLVSVTIPASIGTIGVKAFKGCTALTKVKFQGASLDTLGQAAFQDCQSLTEVVVPKLGDNYVWSSTFEGCTGLKKVTLPEGVTSIGTSAFANCKSLTDVNIPETVKTIKSFAFFSCESLADVWLPDTLKTIGEKAFKNCLAMEEIDLPDVTTLGKAAFFNSGLVEVVVPGTVAKVDDYCFQKCANLQRVELEEGIDETGASVWANDDALEAVVFPSTLKKLGSFAFFRCPSLDTLDGFSGLTSLNSIGEKAFKHCSSLEELALPSQVTAIPKEMCNYCSSLQTVTGTTKVKSYGANAFSNCPALTSVAGLNASELATVKKGRAIAK